VVKRKPPAFKAHLHEFVSHPNPLWAPTHHHCRVCWWSVPNGIMILRQLVGTKAICCLGHANGGPSDAGCSGGGIAGR
jgi:hypothetical protein